MTNIAIVGKLNDGWFGARPPYIDYFSKIGSVSVVAPMELADWLVLLESFQVVVLPGGGDMLFDQYLGIPNMTVGKADPHLEYFDRQLLSETLDSCLVVGICRGAQVLAVNSGLDDYFWQDLPGHPHSATWEETAHSVDVTDTPTPWKKQVNSLHHQGTVVSRRDLNHVMETCNLRSLATVEYPNKDSVILEAFEGENRLAVQWHPEAVGDLTVMRWIRTKLDKGWIRS